VLGVLGAWVGVCVGVSVGGGVCLVTEEEGAVLGPAVGVSESLQPASRVAATATASARRPVVFITGHSGP
jgi:hypothetical protein